MATFITLAKFTDQGIRSVRDTTKRSKAFAEIAEKSGGKLHAEYWTLGRYDMVAVFDAPDDESATALMLGVATMGNVTTETLRAFSADETDKILAKLPKT